MSSNNSVKLQLLDSLVGNNQSRDKQVRDEGKYPPNYYVATLKL
jgi:uncharacterized protein (DUF427 family)